MNLMRSVLILVAVVVSAPAVAGDAKTFESIKENYVDLGLLLETVAESKRDCSCLDEFEEKACIDARNSALDTLKMKFTASLPIGDPSVAIKLGKYDFKKHQFPASLPGGVVHAVPFNTCAAKLKQSDPCANMDGLTVEAAESQVVVSVKSPAWQGQIPVESDEDAQRFRSSTDDAYLLTGELVLKIDGVSLVVRDNPQLTSKKKAFLKAFDEALSRKASRMGADDLAQYREQRRCQAKLPTQDVTVTVSMSVVGLRLEAKASPEYLVSVPPSAERRSDRIEREAAEAAKLAAEQAEKERVAREAFEKERAAAAEAARQKAQEAKDARIAAENSAGQERLRNQALAYRERQEDGCKRGNQDECISLASGYLDDGRIPTDPERAKALLLPLCNKMDARACGLLGKGIAGGKIKETTEVGEAYTALSKAIAACASTTMDSIKAGPLCGLVARELKSGRLVTKNEALAEQYRKKACQRRDADSCEGLEKLQLLGR